MFQLFPRFEDRVLRLQHNVLISYCIAQLLIFLAFVEELIFNNISREIFTYAFFSSFSIPLLVIIFARKRYKLVSRLYILLVFLVIVSSAISLEPASPQYFVFIIISCINLSILAAICINWKIGLVSLPVVIIIILLDVILQEKGVSVKVFENQVSEATFILVLLFLVSMTITMVLTFTSTFDSIIKDYRLEAEKRKKVEDELLEKNMSLNTLNSELEGNMALLEETYDRMEYAFQKAKESDDLKTAFLENISHEVRTPLNAIQGFLGLIKEQNEQYSCNLNELIDPTIDAGTQLINTITDIVELAHIDANIMSIEKEKVDLKEYFFDKHAEFSRTFEAKGIVFLLNYFVQDHFREIYTDRWKLDQILNQLLLNAIKFTFEGKVQIDCAIEDNCLVISVIDTGIGISKKNMDTIFDKFRKGDIEDNSTLFRGLGVGLTIAKELVNCLNGIMKVESEENKGSVFTVKLPVEIFSDKAPTLTVSKTQKKTGSILKILIAEDDVSNFYYMNAILKNEENIKAIHAWNGQEAIDFFKAGEDFDLILMDIKMPVKDGVEAFREIKEINDKIPIYAITAYALNQDRRKYVQMGFDGFVSKPVRKENLLKILQEYQ